MASPAPVGRGSRNKRAPSKGRARNKSQGDAAYPELAAVEACTASNAAYCQGSFVSQLVIAAGAGPSAAPRLAPPDPADLQYAAQQASAEKIA